MGFPSLDCKLCWLIIRNWVWYTCNKLMFKTTLLIEKTVVLCTKSMYLVYVITGVSAMSKLRHCQASNSSSEVNGQ